MDLFDGADQGADLRVELENKWKEKTPEELLKAKIDSDLYIKTLEKQKDEMRNDVLRLNEELSARTNLQDLIDRLNQQQQSPDPAPRVEDQSAKGLAPEDVERLVLAKIEQSKLAEKENDNLSRVHSKLKERFGDNTARILKEQANTLGLSNDDVNALARKSPEAFFRLMGLNERPREDFMAPPRNDRRNDNFAPTTEKRTWTWYQNLKRTNPTLYFDPKTQVQMHRDAASLGNSFEDGDFTAYGPND